ncbi:MAG: short chain dehydrogenase [Longimicrobiales bacterium]|nr:short chain dehydrogenase [Longimicrobiales bacterium]
MKVLHVGATGTIGEAVAEALEEAGHQVVRVGHSSGEYTVDLADKASIEALYHAVGPVDAVVCTAGVAEFGPVDELEDEAYEKSLGNKLMGQVNLVRLGLDRVADGGSFTLTSGTLTTDPDPGTAAVAMVGGAVEAFGRAAALDLEGRHRLNVVSPGGVAETRERMGMDPEPGIWASDLAAYYVEWLTRDESGKVVEATEPRAD